MSVRHRRFARRKQRVTCERDGQILLIISQLRQDHAAEVLLMESLYEDGNGSIMSSPAKPKGLAGNAEKHHAHPLAN
jgi:hypothetical protein